MSYVFPPVGGVGVTRVLKLAKYLPHHGVRPAILTASNPSVPLRDESLLREVSPELEILTARTMEPSYERKKEVWISTSPIADASSPPLSRGARWKQRLVNVARQALVPDPQLLWQPDAQRVLARRLFSRAADDVVFMSAPPFSTFLSAPLIRASGRSAVVLDYRDEWITLRSSYEMLASRLATLLGGPMEAAVLRCAHFVTTATEAFRENLLEHFPFLDPARVIAIPNGYDPSDFPAERPAPPSDRFTVSYAGTVYKLTSPRGFLAGVRLLHERSPQLAKLLDVRFTGRIVDTQLDAFTGMDRYGVHQVGFLPKDEVALEQSRSHVTLCLQDDVPGNERIYQAKIFELMYLGRPCLTIAPPGALAALCAEHRLGVVIDPRDPPAIAAWLEDAIRRWQEGTFSIEAEATGIERYHRRAIAGTFADVFREAASLASRRQFASGSSSPVMPSAATEPRPPAASSPSSRRP